MNRTEAVSTIVNYYRLKAQDAAPGSEDARSYAQLAEAFSALGAAETGPAGPQGPQGERGAQGPAGRDYADTEAASKQRRAEHAEAIDLFVSKVCEVAAPFIAAATEPTKKGK